MHDSYDRILVPTDGGELAVAAARRAIGLAETYGATLHAIHVVDTGTGWLTVSKDEVRDALRDVGQEASREALRVVEDLAADSDVELVTASLEGSPERLILDYAAEEDVDLIVMGTHRRSGLERRLVGSVTERVVRGADVPVMTVSDPGSN
jgi:nucleotide-binding universal stress UspA family protein